MGSTDYQRTKLLLESKGQAETGNILDPVLLKNPVYIDGLALSYLLHARVLRQIAAAKKLRIHPAAMDEMRSLVEADDTGHTLANRIHEIRRICRYALGSEKASLLPHTASQSKLHMLQHTRFEATESLLAGSEHCDVLCIDDRYINGQMTEITANEKNLSVACVLDVLRLPAFSTSARRWRLLDSASQTSSSGFSVHSLGIR